MVKWLVAFADAQTLGVRRVQPEFLPDAGKQVRERFQTGPVRTVRECESVCPREGLEK